MNIAGKRSRIQQHLAQRTTNLYNGKLLGSYKHSVVADGHAVRGAQIAAHKDSHSHLQRFCGEKHNKTT